MATLQGKTLFITGASRGIGKGIALAANKPLMGVCVGMQMLLERSEEGPTDGLGLIPGEVVRFRLAQAPSPASGACATRTATTPKVTVSPGRSRAVSPIKSSVEGSGRKYSQRSRVAGLRRGLQLPGLGLCLGAGHGDEDVDHGHLDLRLLLPRQHHHRKKAQQNRRDHHQGRQGHGQDDDGHGERRVRDDERHDVRQHVPGEHPRPGDAE